MAGPMNPAEYDEEREGPQNDHDLEEDGYAAGLDVWAQVEKAYVNYLGGENLLANCQLWSLREAIRAEYAAESGGRDAATRPERDAARDDLDLRREAACLAVEHHKHLPHLTDEVSSDVALIGTAAALAAFLRDGTQPGATP